VKISFPAFSCFVAVSLCLLFGALVCGCKNESQAQGLLRGGKSKNEGAVTMEKSGVFEPVVAGAFYPANPVELKSMVEKDISAAGKVKLPGRILGIVSPHAGYIYSGPAAGWAFKQIAGMNFDLAVVMAPSHRFRADTAGLLQKNYYRTPLGEIPIAVEYNSALLKSPFFSSSQALFSSEHSMEVQLPFLQISLPGIKIIPIILPTHDARVLDGTAETLYSLLKNKKVIYIASSDMSHYKPYKQNNMTDEGTLEVMGKMNSADLLAGERNGTVELCGLAPVYVIWKIAELSGGGRMTVLKHENSGDTAGDKKAVVGYGAVAVTIQDNSDKK